jgi:voltage-gated potassium channel
MLGDDLTSEAPDQQITLRRRLFLALNGGLTGEGKLSIVNRILVSLIIASTLFAVFDSEEGMVSGLAPGFHLIEIGFGLIFLLEYVTRVWTSQEDPRYRGLKGILHFVLTPAALVDLLALSPLVFAAIGSEAYVLRLLRLLRMLRLTKIGRYSGAAIAIWDAIRLRRYELGISLLAGVFLMLISAACLYAVEGADQPDKFGSILRAMWWSVSTLTVGYGDVYPITTLGKVLASVTALIGIGLIAVPTGIIASAFGQVLASSSEADDDEPSKTADANDFRATIAAQLQRAERQGRDHHEINAGELHRQLGGDPGTAHRMPSCCDALRDAMAGTDRIVFQPDGGNGASLTIRYELPRLGEGATR